MDAPLFMYHHVHQALLVNPSVTGGALLAFPLGFLRSLGWRAEPATFAAELPRFDVPQVATSASKEDVERARAHAHALATANAAVRDPGRARALLRGKR